MSREIVADIDPKRKRERGNNKQEEERSYCAREGKRFEYISTRILMHESIATATTTTTKKRKEEEEEEREGNEHQQQTTTKASQWNIISNMYVQRPTNEEGRRATRQTNQKQAKGGVNEQTHTGKKKTSPHGRGRKREREKK